MMANKVVNASILTSIMLGLLSLSAYAVPPNVVDDVILGVEDTALVGNVLSNDSPTSGTGLTVVGFTGPTGFTIATNGAITYSPVAEFSGVLNFTYTAREDDLAACTPVVPICERDGSGQIFIAPDADLPVVNTTSPVGGEDSAIPLGITVTPSDPSETVTATISGLPVGSVLSAGVQQPDQSWLLSLGQIAGVTLTPPTNFVGPITVDLDVTTTETVNDHNATPVTSAASANTSFGVTITAVNDDPVYVGPTPALVILEDNNGSVDLAGTVTDVDIATNGDSLNYNVTTINNSAVATAVMAGSTLNVVTTPNQFQVGGNIMVEVTDSAGGAPVLLTVPVDVTPVNDDPAIVGPIPTLITTEDVDGSVDLAGVVDDADILTNGDSLTYSVVGPVSHGAVSGASFAGSVLSVTVIADANANGNVQVNVADSAGGTPVVFAVPVQVTPVNDDPFLAGVVPTLDVDEDVGGSVSLAGLVDDVDILTNGDTLSYAILPFTNSAISGAAMVGTDLTVSVVPDEFLVGGSITVRVTDAAGAPPVPVDLVVTVNVNPVNDAPTLVAGPAAVDVLEDSADVTVDFSAAFADVDSVTGDSLTLSASFDSGDAILASNTISGTDLILSFVGNANGTANVRVVATDSAGESVDYVLPVTVQAVNDAPVLVGSLGNRNIDEDDPPEVVNLGGAGSPVFDDVDIATNGDVLTYEVSANTNPGIFTSVGIAGDLLTLTLVPNAFGSADISVIARDSAGATSPPATFTVTVNSVDDMPDAIDDVLADIVEDSGQVRLDVLANDYMPDLPTVIQSIASVGTHDVIDANGDTITTVDGTVAIDGNEIVFTPTPNFHGLAEFEYVIRDVDGDEDQARVTFNVLPANDAPEATQTHYYSVIEGSTLTVDAVNGLLVGAFDIDPSYVDADGNPLVPEPLSARFKTNPDPLEGILTTTTSDGAFTFVPTIGFTGTTGFKYAVFDNVVESAIGDVVIEVLPLPPVPSAPNPGEVAVLYNLANTPLEQSASVQPNVLVTMDDSGSMDWNITVDSTDDNGRFVINNSSIATSYRRSSIYSYLFALNVNAYSAFSSLGRVLPSEESLPAGNDYNVWQARSSAFNNIYYDPTVTYEPWSGLDNGNVDFADANPAAIRLDPVSGSNLYDITTVKSYTSTSVPNWSSSGGSASINVTNFYIPRYYTPAGVRVEIRNNGSTYPGVGRDDCAANNGTCTYAEEIQNFANWFQYYRSRELVAKAAIGNVVAELQDIRVGYETINRRSNEPIAEMNEYYWEGDKKELLDTIYNVNSSGGTPLRRALNDAGRVLGCTHSGRGCPALPAPEGICQQNFTLLFSDGYWNGSTPRSGNFDADGPGVFDGGKFADTHSNTLADIAMYYYENDLFPATDDGVPLSTSDIQGVPDGTYTSATDLIHQHMKTFTIAFGVTPDIDPATAEQALATASFTWPSPGSAANAKIDDMLHAAINGRGRFLNAGNPQELQTAVGTAFREFTQAASSSSAAAFNSTSLREGTLLYRGFYDLRNRTGELTASTVSTAGIVSDTPTWEAAHLLDADDPDGLTPAERVIFTFNPSTNSGIPFTFNSLTANQQATLSLNQVNFMRGERNFEEPSGPLRKRLDDEGLLGDIVNSSPVFVGAPRSFNRDQEPYPTSDLYSEFTDDVHDRRKLVYVGANDGMMHAFDALTGKEVMAYVPNAILDSSLRYTNKLNSYTSAFYLHDYFVDLSPRLNDVYMRPSTTQSKRWMTTLVGGLGAGGKGYFGLNVTDPATLFADQSTAIGASLWEFTEADDTYPIDKATGLPLGGADGAILDFNNEPVKDLGYAFSLPVVTLSNVVDSDTENEWVAIFGNGANSTSGIATLFILFMDKGLDGWQTGDFKKISTGFGVPLPGEQLEGYPNALGSPTAVDRDLNGTVDLVYAGDRLGNLWRFNVENANPALWTSTRLFTATYDTAGVDVLQPILSKPLVVKHPEQDGFLITFGTGSFIAEGDGTDTSIQSIYTIWDQGLSSAPTALAGSKTSRLVEQTLTNVVDDSVTPAQTRRILSTNSVSYAPEGGSPGVYGWYIDLDMVRATDTLGGVANTDISGQAPPDVQFPGEKAIRRFIFRDGVILTTTVLPSTNTTSCFGSRPGAILIIDALTGGDPGEAVIDFNLDGYVDDADLLSVNGQDFTAGLVFDHTQLDGQLVDLSTLGGEGDTDFLFICGGNECISRRIRDVNDNKTGRLSWTELRK